MSDLRIDIKEEHKSQWDNDTLSIKNGGVSKIKQDYSFLKSGLLTIATSTLSIIRFHYTMNTFEMTVILLLGAIYFKEN